MLSLLKSFYPPLLAILLLTLIFLTLRPVQAAPALHPLQTDILVTTTIQAAIDTANPGDTIIVPAGTYTESLTLSKAVSLTGVSSATTIIHALPNQRVLTVTGATINSSVVISGLTLTGGRVTGGSSCPASCGAGILIINSAQPLLKNLIVKNNKAGYYGGGIYTETGNPQTLSGVTVISNSANAAGGGMLIVDVIAITNTIFISNSTALTIFLGSISGGGGLVAFGPAKITDSYFESNTSNLGYGGGLVGRNITLQNVDFIDNKAALEGGGAIVFTGTLTGGRFEQNTASSGGGLAAGGPLTVTNIPFIHNSAEQGGGIYYNNGIGQIINILFVDNIVTDTGAALYLYPSNNLYSPNSVEILHTTIADVSLNPKAAIAVVSGTVGVTNTIIASHSVAISRTAGTVFEDYNLFFGNALTTTGGVASGGHSLNGEPKFVAPASDDYHLSAGSAALNIAFPGLVNSDFEGDPRPLGLGPDIGFDESGGAPVGPGLYLPLILKN